MAASLQLKITILICFVLFTIPALAQSVKLKDDKVFIDGKEVFKYKNEKAANATITLMDLNTNEELIFIREDDGGTYGADRRGDDFTIYIFLKEKIRVEVSTFDYWKNDIKFLFKQAVFDTTGKLDHDKIVLFKEKYDENISEKRGRRQ